MKISDALKRQFVKDLSLPINLVLEPYFSYFLELYDNQFNTLKKFEVFKELISRKNEDQFRKLSKSVIDSMIQDIKATSAYQDFNNNYCHSKDDEELVSKISKLASKKDIYKQTNVGKNYISIDLKKANFQSLKSVNPEIVFNANIYEDLLANYTNEKYFFLSKQIRQIVFGNLNPKKTTGVQKMIVANLVQRLFDLGVSSDHFVVFSHDEAIFLNENRQYDSLFEDFVQDCEYNLHLEFFVLNQVHEDYSYFSKDFDDHSFVLKNVPSKNYPEVLKYKTNQDLILDRDLVFIEDGRICRFEKPLF